MLWSFGVPGGGMGRKYPAGRTLKIWLDEGSPIENVPGSLIADGHKVLSREKKGNYWEISVVKSDSKV